MPNSLTTNILVVDDSAFDRAQIKQYLSQANPHTRYMFHEADWGREAVALLQAYGYDGVFLNCHLPDMDRLTILQRLYDAGLDAQGSPTVLMTLATDERSRMDALRFGVQDFLIKDHLNAAGVSLALQKAQAVHALAGPLSVNQMDGVTGVRTELVPIPELAAMGVGRVSIPIASILVAHKALSDFFAALHASPTGNLAGELGWLSRFEEYTDFVGLRRYRAMEEEYLPASALATS